MERYGQLAGPVLRAALSAVAMIGLSCQVLAGDTHADQELARLLADGRTRQATIEKIVSSRENKIPLLLSWLREPPPNVDSFGLAVGLAQVLGELKPKEAIPLLIKNIGVQTLAPRILWTKRPGAIEQRLPCAAALIKYGPQVSEPLRAAYWKGMTLDDRLAAIFVISRIAATMKDPQEEREFLRMARGAANLEEFWADEGLKLLDEHHQPR